jgi:hypothetical protein
MELYIIYSDRQGKCDFETIPTKILGEGTIHHSLKEDHKTTRYETNSKYLNCSGDQWVDIEEGRDYAEERGLNSGHSGADLFGYRKRFYLDKSKASEYYVNEEKRIEEKYINPIENTFKINQMFRKDLDDMHYKVMKVVFKKGIPYFILSMLITSGLLCLILLLKSPLLVVLIFCALMILFTLSITQIVKVIQNKVLDSWDWSDTFKNIDKILEEEIGNNDKKC